MSGFVHVLLANWKQAFWGGVIVISAVIVIMGMIKTLFDKVQNKYLRKFLLALASVILVLPVSAIYFVCAGVNYKYFWWHYLLLACGTIIVYWLYENTCLRELIHKIGSNTIGRFFKYFSAKITADDAERNDDLKDFTEELQLEAKNEAKSALPSFFPEEKKEEKIRIPIASTTANTNTNISVTANRFLEKDVNEFKNL